MSKTIGPKSTILNTTANLAAANGTWYSVEGADEVEIEVKFNNTGNAHIDFDLYNNNGNAASYTTDFTANNISVWDDPMGAIRGWANNMDGSGGDQIQIFMRKVYKNRR